MPLAASYLRPTGPDSPVLRVQQTTIQSRVDLSCMERCSAGVSADWYFPAAAWALTIPGRAGGVSRLLFGDRGHPVGLAGWAARVSRDLPMDAVGRSGFLTARPFACTKDRKSAGLVGCHRV